MESEFRRFIIKGTPEQQKALEMLIQTKGLTREDVTLILQTVAFRGQDFDTSTR